MLGALPQHDDVGAAHACSAHNGTEKRTRWRRGLVANARLLPPARSRLLRCTSMQVIGPGREPRTARTRSAAAHSRIQDKRAASSALAESLWTRPCFRDNCATRTLRVKRRALRCLPSSAQLLFFFFFLNVEFLNTLRRLRRREMFGAHAGGKSPPGHW